MKRKKSLYWLSELENCDIVNQHKNGSERKDVKSPCRTVRNSDSVNPAWGAKALVTPTNICSPMKLIDQVNADEGCLPSHRDLTCSSTSVKNCWRQIRGKFGFQVKAETTSPFFSPTNLCRKSSLVKPFFAGHLSFSKLLSHHLWVHIYLHNHSFRRHISLVSYNIRGSWVSSLLFLE